MKETKKRLEVYSFYDRTGLEAHLQEMAEKGWLLEKIGTYLWTYRKIEPKQLTFSVCYFPKASQFDPHPSEEQETFYDFCRHTGWVLAASNAQLQVFYNDRDNPTPIETDPVSEVATIHRTMKRSILPAYVLLLVLGGFELFILLSDLIDDPIGSLSSSSGLFSMLCFTGVMLLAVVELWTYFRWRGKAVKLAQQGEFYRTRSHRAFQYGFLAVLLGLTAFYLLTLLTGGDGRMTVLVLLMFLVYVPGLFLVVNGIKRFLKKKGVSKGINRVVTMVGSIAIALALVGGITALVFRGSSRGWFTREGAETYTVNGHTWTAYNDPLPLTLADLSIPAEESLYSREQTVASSPLLKRLSAEENPRFGADWNALPQFSYTLVEVKVPFFYDMCKNQLLHERDYWNEDEPEGERYVWSSLDPAPWGAEEAYCYRDTRYEGRQWFLLCYEDRLVELFLCPSAEEPWTPTAAQMAMVGEKLGK